MFKTFKLTNDFRNFITNYPNIIYLNSAATTIRPDIVIDTFKTTYLNFPFSTNSIDNQISALGLNYYEMIRNQIAAFFNCESNGVVFTPSTTFSLNQIAFGFAHQLQKGDEIILSDLDHNANLAPWIALTNKLNCKIKYLQFSFSKTDYLQQLNNLLTKRTKIVTFPLIDNTISYHLPIKEIISLLRKFNPEIKIIGDATQMIGKCKFDFKQSDFDLICFSAHKMFGPFGMGVILSKPSFLKQLEPFLKGANSVIEIDKHSLKYNIIPNRFEGGTNDLPTLFAFQSALNFLKRFDLVKIANHTHKLYQYCLEKLKSIPGIDIFAPKATFGASLIFNFRFLSAHDVAIYLADVSNIILRSGNHCAFLSEKIFKIKQTLRISFHFYNDLSDIDKLYKVLKTIAQNPQIVLQQFHQNLQKQLFEHGKTSEFPLLNHKYPIWEIKNTTCSDFLKIQFFQNQNGRWKFAFQAEACLITVATLNLVLKKINDQSITKIIQLLNHYIDYFTSHKKTADLPFLDHFGQLFYQKHRLNCALFWAKFLLKKVNKNVSN